MFHHKESKNPRMYLAPRNMVIDVRALALTPGRTWGFLGELINAYASWGTLFYDIYHLWRVFYCFLFRHVCWWVFGHCVGVGRDMSYHFYCRCPDRYTAAEKSSYMRTFVREFMPSASMFSLVMGVVGSSCFMASSPWINISRPLLK